MTVVLIIVGALVGINIIGFAVNNIFFRDELKGVTPYGRMVEVNGRKMHVYSIGRSGKTIVLLPGFGVSLPCADFGPLMRELSKDNTAVCVEYFGIGFSEQADTPRTNENYMEEIRAALRLAGFQPPYVLMPHSASGVYCEFYAAKHPEEVSGIVMIDTTSTAKNKAKNPPKFVYSIGKFQQACGLTRLAPSFQKKENGYTEKEIKDYKRFTGHVLNDTIIDQSLRLLENINEVSDMPFPLEIPVVKLISSQSEKKAGKVYQEKHLERLGEAAESKVLEGTHFLYQTKAVEISEEARDLIDRDAEPVSNVLP